MIDIVMHVCAKKSFLTTKASCLSKL